MARGNEIVNDYFNNLLAGDRDSLFLLVVIYFLLAGLYGTLYSLRMRLWPSVVGELEKEQLEYWYAGGEPQDRLMNVGVLYRYEVDGVTYEGHRVSPFYLRTNRGASYLLRHQQRGFQKTGDCHVRVYYDPKRPERAFLVVPSWQGFLFIAAFGLTPLILHWLI